MIEESVVDEVKCALRDIKNRMEEIVLVPEDDSAITAAKRAYFTYLRMVDSLLFVSLLSITNMLECG
jgi:IMP cyclohydrolase